MYYPNDVLPNEDAPHSEKAYRIETTPATARLRPDQQLADDPRAFADYLAYFQDQETVGVRCAPTACPIARFLAARGVAFPAVIDGCYGLYLPEQTLFAQRDQLHLTDPRFLPEWAVSFVEIIDGAADTTIPLVSAAEAREALAQSVKSSSAFPTSA